MTEPYGQEATVAFSVCDVTVTVVTTVRWVRRHSGQWGRMVAMITGEASNNSLIVELTPGHASGRQFRLRVTPEFEAELAGMLRENDLYGGEVIELTEPITILAVISIAVGSKGALTRLADVLTTFIKRHDGKEITLRSHTGEVKMTGYSRRDVEQLVQKTAELQEQWDQQSLQQRTAWAARDQAHRLERAEKPEDK
jgi:Effector Associated Constant Component 1